MRIPRFWRRRQRLDELGRDLEDYLDRETDVGVAQGLHPEEARRAARRKLGNSTALMEEVYHMNTIGWVESLWQDVKYAARGFRLNRGFTAVAVLSLALGIGANTAIFSVLDAVLWKMLPVREPEQLVFLERRSAIGNISGPGGKFRKFCDISYELMREFGRRSPALAGVTTYMGGAWTASIDGQLEPVSVLQVDGDFYSVLGVRPHAGRLLQPEDIASADAAVLSYGYWQRRFGGQTVTGKPITINGKVYTIAEITPPDFFGLMPGESFDVSVPIAGLGLPGPGPSPSDPRSRRLFYVIARLKPNVTEEAASQSLTLLLRQMMRDEQVKLSNGDSIETHRIAVTTASQGLAMLRTQFSKPLAAVMTLVVIVLLITCANLANLLLARATARQREISIRASIGAGRGRLVRQLLTENLFLGLAGGALGLVVAYWGKEGLLWLASIGRSEPMPINVSLDHRALIFTLAISLLTALLFGLAPAWRGSRAGANAAAMRRPLLGKALVTAEVAMSIVLLLGAGLFVRSFQNLTRQDTGFRRDHMLLVGINPMLAGMKEPQNRQLFMAIVERIRLLPGVAAASYSRMAPLGGGLAITGIAPPGYMSPPGEDTPLIYMESVGPRYFETQGMLVMAGRDFRAEDNAGAPKVIAINKAAAMKYFPGQHPIGQRMGHHGNRTDFEVIAVVADARRQNLRAAAVPTAYLPVLQSGDARDTIFQIRTTGDPLALAPAARQIVRDANPAIPVMSVRTLEELENLSLVQERMVATLSGLFGAMALALASMGIAGVLSFAVARRTSEIGIRMALGARRDHVIWMVTRESLALAAVGVLIGLPCAIGAATAARSLLFGLEPADPATVIFSVLLLGLVAAAAASGPARRAARINPIQALRCER